MKTQYTMNIAVFSTEQLISIVSKLLCTMLETNDQIKNTRTTYFHSRTIPNISIHTYLMRIYKFAPFDSEALLSMLIYFDRIAKMSDFIINSYNIHRLLITSIMVASKYTSDVYFANTRYAKIGGISLHELNQLELELLFMSEFHLYITLEELQAYADQLLTYAMTLPPPSSLSPPPPPPPLAIHIGNTDTKSIILQNRNSNAIKPSISLKYQYHHHPYQQHQQQQQQHHYYTKKRNSSNTNSNNKAPLLPTPPYHPIINKAHPYYRPKRQ